MRPATVALGILLAAGLATVTLFALRAQRGSGPPDTPRDDATPAEPSAIVSARADLVGELPEVLVDPRVRVVKSARTLSVFSAGEVVKIYGIALGRCPEGDKEREGDGRTPVGEFFVCEKNAASKYHRSLGLSYPNLEDADRGLATGMISKRDHRAIRDAINHMRRPPWKTPLGGEIMIHGGGTSGDWTEGCIAMSDDDAEELFSALPLGTPIEIAE